MRVPHAYTNRSSESRLFVFTKIDFVFPTPKRILIVPIAIQYVCRPD